jgi:phenylalanyl-tRNA synthetase alpha chain
MDQILQQIEKLKSEIASAKTDNAEALESFRTRFLGTKGLVKSLMGEMKNVPVEQKKEFGQVMNAFKQFAEEKYEALRSTIANGEHPADRKPTSACLATPYPQAAGTR